MAKPWIQKGSWQNRSDFSLYYLTAGSNLGLLENLVPGLRFLGGLENLVPGLRFLGRARRARRGSESQERARRASESQGKPGEPGRARRGRESQGEPGRARESQGGYVMICYAYVIIRYPWEESRFFGLCGSGRKEKMLS